MKKRTRSTRPRCGRKTRAGTPCQRFPIAGATVCRKHGGAAPQVKRKAAERLADLIDPNRALREIATLAYSNIQGVFDNRGNLLPPHKWPEDVARTVRKIEVVKRNITVGDGLLDDVHKVEFWDKLKALEMLAKHLGLLVERMEHSGGIDVRWDDGPNDGPEAAPLGEGAEV